MSFSRTYHSALMYIVSVVTALSTGVCAYLAFDAGLAFGGSMTVLAVLTTCVLLSFAAVRVDATTDGVVLRSGLFGLPLTRARSHEVTGLGVQDVSAPQWGGWGLRFTRHGTALILRNGTAAVIERREKRKLVIAVNGAEDLAELLRRMPAYGLR